MNRPFSPVAALRPVTPLEWLCVPLWPLAVAALIAAEVTARICRRPL